MKKQPADINAAPVAAGTGLLALDVVLSETRPEEPRYWAGGTCGNVLVVLRYLGWQSAPIARLREGAAASELLADLQRWGVTTSFVTLSEDGSTPVIVERISRGREGEVFHSFSWRCPNCGARLPGYKPVLATKAEELVERLGYPRVFFFDRLSRGAIILARAAAERGAAIVFEPSSIANPALFREAWELADVVKYSHERLNELPTDLEARKGPKVQIETLGREGLRYRTRLPGCKSRAWHRLKSIPAARLQDTAGAGDWCTAGIVDRLFPAGASALETATDARVRDAVRYGQALGAWTCGFEGARGGMYEVEKDRFDEQIAELLGSRWERKSDTFPLEAAAENAMTCLCPSCEQKGDMAARAGARRGS
jgi:sugar/nucleoside kinase (ribokinase family)